MSALGLVEGQSVEIASRHGAIQVPAHADAAVRRGVVSVPHGWGDLRRSPGYEDRDAAPGANTNELTSTQGSDPINAMPLLTGLAVRLRAVATVQ
jgi:anaerobic selenocysteine-containing dehydrogenase